MRGRQRARSRAPAARACRAGSSRRATSARAISASRTRAALGVLEIERDALLVAVDAQEIRALAVDERRSPGARVVAAARMLDLDDPRAHVGEQHRAVRARQHARQVQHRHAGQRTRRMRSASIVHTATAMSYRCLVRYWPFSGVPEEGAMNRSVAGPCRRVSCCQSPRLRRRRRQPVHP